MNYQISACFMEDFYKFVGKWSAKDQADHLNDSRCNSSYLLKSRVLKLQTCLFRFELLKYKIEFGSDTLEMLEYIQSSNTDS